MECLSMPDLHCPLANSVLGPPLVSLHCQAVAGAPIEESDEIGWILHKLGDLHRVEVVNIEQERRGLPLHNVQYGLKAYCFSHDRHC